MTRHLATVTRSRSHPRGYTLIEVLVLVVIMGIAGAMVIPALGDTHILRVQAALRTIVADITFAQADAAAFQERRAVVFDVNTNSYRVIQVPGNTLDIAANTIHDPTRPFGLMGADFTQDEARYGAARLISANFGNGSNALIFDALGGPVSTPDGNTPGPGGIIGLGGSGATWTISVEAFTGRVTVAQDAPAATP